jgi:hypothetical protein
MASLVFSNRRGRPLADGVGRALSHWPAANATEPRILPDASTVVRVSAHTGDGHLPQEHFFMHYCSNSLEAQWLPMFEINTQRSGVLKLSKGMTHPRFAAVARRFRQASDSGSGGMVGDPYALRHRLEYNRTQDI